MPLNLPNLDDRNYTDLVEEARGLITTFSPEWTNHNPTDPGITLIELFAYLTEMLIYRVNLVTDANKRKFLKLLKGTQINNDGTQWNNADEGLQGDELKNAIESTLMEFRKIDRAVTRQDFESLTFAADPKVARSCCVPRRNLVSYNLHAQTEQNPGHVSIIIVPYSSFNAIFLYDSSFHDCTEKASTEGSLDFALLENNSGQKDFLYIGSEVCFNEIRFQFSETGRNYQLVFEYYNGSDWVQLDTQNNALSDYTVNWTFNGLVQFSAPTDWKKTGVHNSVNFWLRVSTSTSPLAIAKAVRIIPKILQPDEMLIQKVRQYLEPRRLLTTLLHIVGPCYLSIHVRLTIVAMPDGLENTVRSRVVEALWRFFDPLVGSNDGKGWPFGRAIYVSDIYALLDTLPGIDYVKKTTDSQTSQSLDEIVVENSGTDRYAYNDTHELVAVKLLENELVDFRFVKDAIFIELPKE